ncbi:MAG: hypothetical protein JNM07_12170 [Phycisphaerae bacterium]|nr:hypothetical protein [Phycisphaerae bacterium]
MNRAAGCLLCSIFTMTAATALAQPCTPSWDGAPGTVGINSGYVGALRAWNDGTGERLYAGGSFARMGGLSGTGYVARWNPTTGTWAAMGSGISAGSTNAFVTSILPYAVGSPSGLVVAGFFDRAGGVNGTRSIAVWTGSAWQAFPVNPVATSPASIWAMSTWPNDPTNQNRLYVGGAGLADIAGTPSNGIQAWNGAAWAPVATVNGPFSPTVFSLAVFDDGSGPKLYAGGRFNSIGGLSAQVIARWDGTTWSKVGAGLVATDVNFAQISAMTVFNDGTGPALYVAGGYFRCPGGGQTQTSVAKWNGSTWTRVGQNVGGYIYGLTGFNDGTGNALYLGGTAVPTVGYVARLESGSWTVVDGGLTGSVGGNFPSCFSLLAWDKRLVVGGDFTAAGSTAARGIVFRKACPCPGDYNHDGVVDDFDFFDFLNDFFANSMAADVNGDTSVDDFDYFDFLNALNTPC